MRAGTAKAVYVGLAGGASYNSQGSGANLLCLPRQPETAPGEYDPRGQSVGMSRVRRVGS